MKGKPKVHLTTMRTSAGSIVVLSNFQKVNRPTKVFHAEKESNGGRSSVFFIVRPKDVDKLIKDGYTVQSIEVPKLHYPVAINWPTGTILETRKY